MAPSRSILSPFVLSLLGLLAVASLASAQTRSTAAAHTDGPPRSVFDRAAIERAIRRDITPGAMNRFRLAQVSGRTRGRDSLMNGALIGAGVGALLGGVLAAGDDCDQTDDFGGACGLVGGPAVGAGILVGALCGAGIGVVVDALIR